MQITPADSLGFGRSRWAYDHGVTAPCPWWEGYARVRQLAIAIIDLGIILGFYNPSVKSVGNNLKWTNK